ncbi:MAG: hypothetical protein KJ767_03740 [Nanoarchaeota archaeon]|nr:hypothetical protein [Nanoarchaeota archaeon]
MSDDFKTKEGEINTVGRMTAYKVWLSDIKEREFKQQQGVPSHVDINGRRVSRVNIIASVVDKFVSENQNYSSLTLDDGSEQLRLKAFADSTEMLNAIEIGDIILTIAKLRTYNNETYLMPEILRKVSSKEALLRRLELILEHGKREPYTSKRTEQTRIIQEKESTSNPEDTLKEKLRALISKLDEGEGVEITKLEETYPDKEKLAKFIEDFLSEGEAYEPRPGKIKLI